MDKENDYLQYVMSLTIDLNYFLENSDKLAVSNDKELVAHYVLAKNKAYALASAYFDLKNQSFYTPKASVTFHKSALKFLKKSSQPIDLIKSLNSSLNDKNYGDLIIKELNKYGIESNQFNYMLKQANIISMFSEVNGKDIVLSINEKPVMMLGTSLTEFSNDEFYQKFFKFGKPLYKIKRDKIPVKVDFNFEKLLHNSCIGLIDLFDSKLRTIQDIGFNKTIKGKELSMFALGLFLLFAALISLIGSCAAEAAGDHALGQAFLYIALVLAVIGAAVIWPALGHAGSGIPVTVCDGYGRCETRYTP